MNEHGKIERWHKSLKGECIGRERRYRSMMRDVTKGYVDYCNNVRLNGATGYITPKDMLAGRHQEIQLDRGGKLEAARKQRQIRRQQGG